MKIIAKVSFCGPLTMTQGETREYSDEAVLKGLLDAGYVEEVKTAPTEEDAKATPVNEDANDTPTKESEKTTPTRRRAKADANK